MKTLSELAEALAAKTEIWENLEEILDDLEAFAGTHKVIPNSDLAVAPTTEKEKNTIRLRLISVACWRLNDARFLFDSSFIGPAAKQEIKLLAELIKDHPKCPASIFGHADSTGTDDYNKKLSGRRAMAIYGLLTRKTDLWEHLHKEPLGNDKWDDRILDIMRTAVSTGAPDKSLSGAALFSKYMDFLCTDDDTKEVFKMESADFLGEGADAKGKAAYQGCSDFNLVKILSKDQLDEFKKPENKSARDNENAVNRRVVVYLFEPGTKVDPGKWPCPHAMDGPEGCHKRFWSDANDRRANADAIRIYEEDLRTFACRFYDRLANSSPCEKPGDEGHLQHISILLRSNSSAYPIAQKHYKINVDEELVLQGKTDDEGYIYHPHVPPGDYPMEIEGGYKLIAPSIPISETRYELRVPEFLLS